LALDSNLHKTVAMHPMMRHLRTLRRPAVAAAVGLWPLGVLSAFAQQTGGVPFINVPQGNAPTNPPANTAPESAPLDIRPPSISDPGSPATPDALKKREQELAAIRAEQRRTLENEAKLKREIESIGDDRRKLAAQLVEAAGRVRSAEAEIAATMERLTPLDGREQGLRQSLDSRHGVIVEVLAALQRIGRQPTPVMVVRPEDALQSVRTALLLGAVLPEMRRETEVLLADLAELARLRKSIAEERERLDRDVKILAEESPRLTLLIEQRQRQQAEFEARLGAERQRAQQLARQAESLQELIASLERNSDSAAHSERLAYRSGDEKKPLDSRQGLAALKDPGRLAPAVAFATAKKLLPLPVNGVRIREFGAPDGVGGTEKGLSIATRHGSQVTAPCDGWVVYAGPFRNYGQLLILNAGDGYHVLLAGMERISVDLGQFVVTGEPVAVMGSRAQAAATVAAGSGQPVLYVEFRKDGIPVDPGPWWAASEVEKVRG